MVLEVKFYSARLSDGFLLYGVHVTRQWLVCNLGNSPFYYDSQHFPPSDNHTLPLFLIRKRWGYDGGLTG